MRYSKAPTALLATLSVCTAFIPSQRAPLPKTAHRLAAFGFKIQDETQSVHPHTNCWTSTVSKSPNSHISSSIELVVRPPCEGGTGIVATQDIPANSTVMALRLEEVGMTDATSILRDYAAQSNQNDTVLNALGEMWDKELEFNNEQDSQEGKRLAVLAGIVAHLQLVRYKDLTSWTTLKDSYALDTCRKFGPFLDAMPLLPNRDGVNSIPTHFLFWTDDEIEKLLAGTVAQTKAREVRAGVGLIVKEWSASFLKEHSPAVSREDILNAIFSAFASVLSRSFGDEAGRDQDGMGRMLVPVVDMLNHDSEEPNVSWKWHVGLGDEEMIEKGQGDIAVTTIRDVKKGEELQKCYGWRPAWDVASSYGFVPQLVNERWECSALPLFPAVLDLAPNDISSPTNVAGDSTLDLTLEENCGLLLKAVLAATDAAKEIKLKMGDTTTDDIVEDKPHQLENLEVLRLFRPPPPQTADEFRFQRLQPVVQVGTKIDKTTDNLRNKSYHKLAIQSILPAYRAAASAIAQLRHNHANNISSPIEASQMAKAAASIDKDTDWDKPALEMIQSGIDERIQTILDHGKAAEAWIDQVRSQEDFKERQERARLARDVREAELRVLEKLKEEVLELCR